MRILGKVELIVNEKYLLISSSERLIINQVITIFSVFENETIKSKFGLELIGIPKGEVTVTDKESETLYLCEVFSGPKEKRKTIIHPTPFEKIYGGGLSSLFSPTKEEIIETAPGGPSAVLDKEQSLGIVVSPKIQVGDPVGLT